MPFGSVCTLKEIATAQIGPTKWSQCSSVERNVWMCSVMEHEAASNGPARSLIPSGMSWWALIAFRTRRARHETVRRIAWSTTCLRHLHCQLIARCLFVVQTFAPKLFAYRRSPLLLISWEGNSSRFSDFSYQRLIPNVNWQQWRNRTNCYSALLKDTEWSTKWNILFQVRTFSAAIYANLCFREATIWNRNRFWWQQRELENSGVIKIWLFSKCFSQRILNTNIIWGFLRWVIFMNFSSLEYNLQSVTVSATHFRHCQMACNLFLLQNSGTSYRRH